MSNNELASKARELKELKAIAEELTAEITALEDEIKAVMTERNVDELSVDVFKFRWKTVSSMRFDSTGLKKANPELYQQFSKPTVYRRFSFV